jgi:hypothetical protein
MKKSNIYGFEHFSTSFYTPTKLKTRDLLFKEKDITKQ